MARAFMSYSSKDETFADLVRLKLESAGIQVWIDNSELHAGEEWRNAIDDGISSSNVLLVILTRHSCLSSYVTYEWAYALGKGIKIIPLLRENCDMHPRLAVLQYLDFRDQRKGPWDLLADEIRNNNSTEKTENSLTYVRDMTTEELQALINSAVSLATAMKRTSGETSTSENITQAAKTVIDVMQHTRDMSSQSATNSKPRHILWVDDQPDNNIHERATFEAMGFSFTLAQSTHDALQKLSDNNFLAVISDMGRREGPREGYVLLDDLRNKRDQTPFFIYAGSNAQKHKLEAKEHGAQGSTNSPQELFELITQLIS